MIKKTEFSFLLKDLGEVFTMPNENQIEAYYKHLKNTNMTLLRKAFSLLEETYSYRRLPLIAEIKQATKDAFNESKESSFVEPEGCDECKGTGILLKEKPWHGVQYFYAIPCSCAKGKIYQKVWAPYNPRKKIKIRGKPK